MKKIWMAGILAGVVVWTHAQDKPAPTAQSSFQQRLNEVVQGLTDKPQELPRFDIEFRGGSPRELVQALNDVLNGTLNVVIPDEYNDAVIPALRMKQVNVSQVFDALQRASLKIVSVEVGTVNRRVQQQSSQSYEFRTTNPITANSVWSFRFDRPIQAKKVEENTIRYYQLAGHLEDLKIEDIITALQTGWKMLGTSTAPALKFHPETKMLIAVGKESELGMIDEVLKELGKARPKPLAPAPGKPAPVNN